MGMMRRVLLVGLLVCLLSATVRAEGMSDTNAAGGVGTASGAAAATAKEPHYWSDAGFGFAAVIANIVYIPAKVVYGTLGLLTGSLAYAMTVGDSDTAQKVWSPSLGGSYVITPAMLRGDEPILFNGVSYAND